MNNTEIKQISLNNALANLLEKFKIKKINMTCVGNSLSSGYRIIGKTIPLLFRNKTLKEILHRKNISLNTYHFARTENNSDQHTFSYLINNTSLAQINQFNLKDKTVSDKLSEEEKKKYYPLSNIGMQDILKDKQIDLSNIIIYNGATGSFLDILSRNGRIIPFKGIINDVRKIDAFLNYIQELNRNENSNIQIYLCGIPKYLNKNWKFFNRHLENLAKQYANVAYVKPIYANIFYKIDGKIKFDIHFNEEGYNRFINSILDTIINNFELTNFKITIDRLLFEKSISEELDNKRKVNVENEINAILSSLNKDKLNQLKKDLYQYFIYRFPYDFYYIDRSSTIKTFK